MPLYEAGRLAWANGLSAGLASSDLAAGPELGRRSAPGRVDQADGHVEFLVQLAAEVVGRCGEAAPTAGGERFSACRPPNRLSRPWPDRGFRFGDLKQPNLRIVGRRDFLFRVVDMPTPISMFDWPEQTQTSHQNVLQFDFIAQGTFDCHFQQFFFCFFFFF